MWEKMNKNMLLCGLLVLVTSFIGSMDTDEKASVATSPTSIQHRFSTDSIPYRTTRLDGFVHEYSEETYDASALFVEESEVQSPFQTFAVINYVRAVTPTSKGRTSSFGSKKSEQCLQDEEGHRVGCEIVKRYPDNGDAFEVFLYRKCLTGKCMFKMPQESFCKFVD